MPSCGGDTGPIRKKEGKKRVRAGTGGKALRGGGRATPFGVGVAKRCGEVNLTKAPWRYSLRVAGNTKSWIVKEIQNPTQREKLHLKYNKVCLAPKEGVIHHQGGSIRYSFRSEFQLLGVHTHVEAVSAGLQF